MPVSETSTNRGDVTHEELTRLQRTVARRMAESKATAPDFSMTVEADMEAAVARLDRDSATLTDLVVKATALALRDVPRANAAYRDGEFERYSRVNVGVALAERGALVIPTIFDADAKSLAEIAAETRRLAERVRDETIMAPELAGGTFTVFALAGVRRFTAVLNPPQAGILAVGELARRAVVHDGELAARWTVELTLTADHRILYGADAAAFLDRVRSHLESL